MVVQEARGVPTGRIDWHSANVADHVLPNGNLRPELVDYIKYCTKIGAMCSLFTDVEGVYANFTLSQNKIWIYEKRGSVHGGKEYALYKKDGTLVRKEGDKLPKPRPPTSRRK